MAEGMMDHQGVDELARCEDRLAVQEVGFGYQMDRWQLDALVVVNPHCTPVPVVA